MPEINSQHVSEIFSHEVRDIISYKPAWIVRNGIWLFLIILLSILSATFFIKYPDVVYANAKLVSVNRPKEVRLWRKGRLVHLYVKEGQVVHEGDSLGVFENVPSLLFDKRSVADNNIVIKQKIADRKFANKYDNSFVDTNTQSLLKAPFSGKVLFSRSIYENQQFGINDLLCYISQDSLAFFAEVDIPQKNLGKVQRGQMVSLKFLAYPFEKYGIVEGYLDEINQMPYDSFFKAKVILSKGLKTKFQKDLTYREGLIANAEIITDNRKLSDRIFSFLRQDLR